MTNCTCGNIVPPEVAQRFNVCPPCATAIGGQLAIDYRDMRAAPWRAIERKPTPIPPGYQR